MRVLPLIKADQFDVRPFYLHRYEDASGVSGTGIVALGVVLPSGKAVMEWCSPWKTLTVYDSVRQIERIHGHGGRTVLRWGSPTIAANGPADKHSPVRVLWEKTLATLRSAFAASETESDEATSSTPPRAVFRPEPIPLRRGNVVASRYYRS